MKPIGYKQLKVALIADEFTEIGLKKEVETMIIHPHDWKNSLSLVRPDFLFIESAWHNPWNQDVEEVILWCRKKDIPTIFWNKEDPVHFSYFLEIAKLCDYIFTTDESMVPLYKRLLKRNSVYVLPFACQPKIHNPIVSENRKDKAFFAGSYNRIHPRRTQEMDLIFDVVKKYGLDIYDRNYGLGKKIYQFPDRYFPLIKGCVQYNEIHHVYKSYKIAVNVNSVNQSKTMFSRRVFEILACNTPIISTNSAGIRQFFKDIVVATNDKKQLEHECEQLFENSDYYQRKALLGLREVLSYHTYKDRLKFMLSKIDMDVIEEEKSISILAIIKNSEDYEAIKQFVHHQTISINKVILLYNQLSIDNDENYTMMSIDDCLLKPLSTWINTDYVSVIHPIHQYGKNYLKDLVLATNYSDAAIISKTISQNGAYHRTQTIKPYGCLLNSEITPYLTIQDWINKNLNDKLMKLSGYPFIQIDPFNYAEDNQNRIDL